jgi:predicted glutamine amidotransferase
MNAMNKQQIIKNPLDALIDITKQSNGVKWLDSNEICSKIKAETKSKEIICKLNKDINKKYSNGSVMIIATFTDLHQDKIVYKCYANRYEDKFHPGKYYYRFAPKNLLDNLVIDDSDLN